MGDVDVNWFAVILAGLSSYLIGMVWYAPRVFGNRWVRLVGLTQEKMERGAIRALAIAGVMSLLMAYVVAYVAALIEASSGDGDIASALGAAFWLWLGIVATTVITHDSFEQRPVALTALTLGNRLLTLLLMGLIIGLFGV